jgi:hypothetical protein
MDTVVGKDGKSTLRPYSSCKAPCANCESTEHTVFDCSKVLKPIFLERLKKYSRSTTAYTAAQLATIAYKLYKSLKKDSMVSAEADKGLDLRAVLLRYITYPIVRDNATPAELFDHKKTKGLFTALVCRVRKILNKLFASGLGALEGTAKQNVTHGVNYLRELGDYFVKRDTNEGAEWPVGQRSTFDLVTKSGDEMATILIHAAMLKYYQSAFGSLGQRKTKS